MIIIRVVLNTKIYYIFSMANLAQSTLPFLIALSIASAFGLVDANPIPISIASSVDKNQLQMVITLEAELTEQVKLTTGSFSDNHGNHTLRLEQDKIQIIPELDDERVVFNYRHENRFLIALSHTLDRERVRFLPLKVGYGNQWKQFLLGAFDTRMNQIQVNSLLKCHRTLISVNFNEEQIQIRHFSNDKKQTLWVLSPKEKEWRHYFEGTYFGEMTVSVSSLPLELMLPSGKYCVLTSDSLEKNRSHSSLNNQKYYSVDDLLSWAPELQLNEPREEEL